MKTKQIFWLPQAVAISTAMTANPALADMQPANSFGGGAGI